MDNGVQLVHSHIAAELGRTCDHFLAFSMSDEALFVDISPLEDILEKFFTDNDTPSNWIPNQSLIELPSEKDDGENTLLQSQVSFSCNAESAMDSTPQSLQSLQEFNQHISDDELTKLSVRDLNQRLKCLPKAEAKVIRRRRRCLKNRAYATSCRQRRTALKEGLETENQRLKEQLRETRERLCSAVKDRDSYKKRFDRLHKAYATLNEPSFVMGHKQ